MRKFKLKRMKVLIKVIFLLLFISCTQNYEYENSIEKDIKTLSDDSFEGREAGTQGEKEQLNLLKQDFKKLDSSLRVSMDSFNILTLIKVVILTNNHH